MVNIDNISKDTFVQKISKFSNGVLIVCPIIADAVGIISFFTTSLENWLKENIGPFQSILIIAILNIVLLANVIFILERRANQKSDKAKILISGYKELLDEFKDYLIAFDEDASKITTVDELYAKVSECLKVIVDEVKEVLRDVTGRKIRVCIKAFPEIYAHNDITQMELMTFCRSDKTLKASVLERANRVRVQENTDFKLIMSETYPYFAFNNLKNFKKETKTEYQNSTHNWNEKYNATIVYPISKRVSPEGGRGTYQVLGFVCVDTLSVDAFSAEVGPLCIDFISSLSHLLYIFLERCITYREDIETSTNERECVANG